MERLRIEDRIAPEPPQREAPGFERERDRLDLRNLPDELPGRFGAEPGGRPGGIGDAGAPRGFGIDTRPGNGPISGGEGPGSFGVPRGPGGSPPGGPGAFPVGRADSAVRAAQGVVRVGPGAARAASEVPAAGSAARRVGGAEGRARSGAFSG